jgi:putative transposase
MAKAITTITQRLTYHPQQADWFAANQALFNAVTAFYFEVIQAHDQLLTLKTKEALSALETLTHATSSHPHPVMPLAEVGEDIPAMFRRAAINAALGSAKSFSGNLKRWCIRKEKMEAKGKKCTDRPPVPPRTWNPRGGTASRFLSMPDSGASAPPTVSSSKCGPGRVGRGSRCASVGASYPPVMK